MKIIRQGSFTGERALYHQRDLRVEDSVFYDGESPLKEGADLEIASCLFKYRYPVWYCERVSVDHSAFLADTRAGFWYCRGVKLSHCDFKSPKNLRRSEDLCIEDCRFTAGDETLWFCRDVRMKDCAVTGDYFCMNSENVTVEGLTLDGKYSFDGMKNVTVRNSRLITKDCFWNCENVLVEDSYIFGEYLAWNTKNITFRNCVIESNQGICYSDGVKLEHCKLIHTDLAFEFVSRLDATVDSTIDSVKNPISGRLSCEGIGELILEPELVDPAKTEILFPGKPSEK